MICPRCGEDKQPGEFPRNRNTKTGYGAYCKPCHNGRNRLFIEERYGSTRHYHLRQRYRIGDSDVAALIEKQGGLCAICKSAAATQVDHNHISMEVRGVLCLDCNAGLGAFRDDERLLFAAVDYLHPVPIGEWVR